MIVSIRKRRRDRTRNRITNQKRLDIAANERINKSFLASIATWGGTVCPECFKSVPARAFVVVGDIQWSSSCIISVGTSVAPKYCHRDIKRCASESAKEDTWKWKLSPLYQEVSQ